VNPSSWPPDGMLQTTLPGIQAINRWFRVLLLLACAPPGNAQWLMQESGTTAGLRGIHTVDGNVAWASGTEGTVIHTDDGGSHWQPCAIPPGGEKLDFRGIWSWNSRRAVVMSIGPGDQSRLYKTFDGCKTWKQLYVNPDAKGFWDGIVFSDEQKGAILGDPVDGRFVILWTQDGGEHWSRDEDLGLTANAKGEGAFAASNSSLVLAEAATQFGSGGLGGSRIFHMGRRFERPGSKELDRWSSLEAPLAGGAESAGVFSLAYRDRYHGVAVGGDYQKPAGRGGAAAFTSDGGLAWTAATELPSGFRSAVAWDRRRKAWIASGTNGADVSFDDGRTWKQFDGAHNWNALSLPWAVGPKGKIGKLSGQELRQK
jgi:photosystem II stability/assembly factor-like uncharacterized protein